MEWRRFLKFLPHTHLQTAAWVILCLEVCKLQNCLTNLLTEISLTFELLWKLWPSRSRLHSLILPTSCCPLTFLSSSSSPTLFLPSAWSELDHIKKMYCSVSKPGGKKKKRFTFLYLWGKVNLSMVVWTAPRFTLPSLSSSCRSSYSVNNICLWVLQVWLTKGILI